MELVSGPPWNWITDIFPPLCNKWSRPPSGRASMWAAVLSLMLLSNSLLLAAAEISDGCDWTGSGSEVSGEDRGVQPVYLRCSQGSVSWLYPRGAVRIVLRYGTAGKEFQGCLKLKAEFRGANIYVEQHRSLKLLHSGALLEPRAAEKLHCFESRHGQVAIFMESDPASLDVVRKDVAGFTYDLQLRSSHPETDPWDDCRPCTDQETLDTFCSSDFVARGFISGIYNDDMLDRTVLTVRATRVIRQASSVFKPRQPSTNQLIPVPSKWKGLDGMELDLKSLQHVAQLHVPLKCRAKHGSGEFVFMGRQRLGDAMLWCAPRLEDWADLLHRAKRDNLAQCRLES